MSSNHSCALVAGLVLAIAAPLAANPRASKTADAPPTATKLTATETAAVQYIDKSTKLRFPYRLNLGDPQQYAYVMAMLRLAGDSPQKSPQLYKNLEAGQKTAKAGPPELAMGRDPGDVGITLITPINLIQFIYDNGTTASSSLLSSVPGGTDNTTMMINFRLNGQSIPFAVSPTYKQSAGGKQFMQNYSAPLPAGVQAGGGNAMLVIASSLILTSKGTVTTPYTMVLDDATPNATAVCSTAPNYGVNQQPPIGCPAVGAACVNQGPIAQQIKMCYGRQGGDCNYAWGGGGYPTSMLMTVAGSMTFPYPVDASLQGSYILNLQNQNGGCFVPPTSEPSTITSPTFSIDPNNNQKLNFCIAGQALQNAGCLNTAVNTAYLDFTVYALVDAPNGANYGMGKISSNGALNPNQPWFAQVPTLVIVQGCFAEGTEITLPDGSTRKVELFKGDGSEMVLQNAQGGTVKVTSTGDGVEEKPMIRIVDSEGHSLLITQTHAVITGRGPVMAREVRVGDTLYTQKGMSTVKTIGHEMYTKKIHNLFLGDPELAAARQSTMFANGILVGDMRMQQDVFRKAQERGFSHADVLSRLPKEWHQDYLNSVKNGTNK